VELWRQNPIDCIRELIGNPAFKDVMAFVPEKVFSNADGSNRVFDEMWMADWWWEVQVSSMQQCIVNTRRILIDFQRKLKAGATVVPIVLATDETQLSNFQGDKSAWPVYMTIGNIGKETRCQPLSHAQILVGYLPVSKLSCFTDLTQSVAGYRLFHYCMMSILQPLFNATTGPNGIPMMCADGYMCEVFPILAAYVADHPEQCLVACCRKNHCPKCLVSPKDQGKLVDALPRNAKRTYRILRQNATGRSTKAFKSEGLRLISSPFWQALPHSDIFVCITPDILHQLHKGVFKDHLVSWCIQAAGNRGGAEIDARFCVMSDFAGL
jgi:hypothetical protein